MGKARSDLLSVIGHRLKHRAKARSKNQSSASSDICLTSARARKLSYVGPTFLDSVTDYLYWEGQKVETAEQRDAFTLALGICGAARRGEADPVSSAAYKAFGTSFDRYLKYRSQRQWEQHQALLRCIPDYDPQEDHRGPKLQPVASQIIEWPNPIAVGAADRNKPASGRAMGSKQTANGREFTEASARLAGSRKRGLGAG